jgi:hypothetical protein
VQVSGVNVLEVRQEVWRASRRGDIGPRFQRALLGWLGSGRDHCAHRLDFRRRQQKLVQSNRCKTGPGKAVAGRPVASVA